MKYLVHANILSEPTKPAPDPRLLARLRAHERDIAVDTVIPGEPRFGMLITSQGPQADGYRVLVRRWGEASPAMDVDTGLKWAEALARLRTPGKLCPLRTVLSQRRRPFTVWRSLPEIARIL